MNGKRCWCHPLGFHFELTLWLNISLYLYLQYYMTPLSWEVAKSATSIWYWSHLPTLPCWGRGTSASTIWHNMDLNQWRATCNYFSCWHPMFSTTDEALGKCCTYNVEGRHWLNTSYLLHTLDTILPCSILIQHL